MKKYWKIGSIILILASAIAIFSISMASKGDKSISNASPEIAQIRQRRIPPFFRKVMEEEGISPEDLRDNPELREKLREKVRRLREERGGGAVIAPSGERRPKPTKEGPPKATKPSEERKEKGKEDYYKVIMSQNLFRPLGSGAEKKGPLFGLLGTVIAKSEGEVNRALIMDYRKKQSVYVAEGEKIGDATVEKIEPRHVVLLHKGKMKDFYIQEMQFIGGGKGGGGRGGPRGGGPSSSSPAMKRSSGQGRTQKMNTDEWKKRFKEKMKNRSKEEIEKMKRMMEERGRRDRPRGRRGDNRMIIRLSD